jgi:hypothetical protein
VASGCNSETSGYDQETSDGKIRTSRGDPGTFGAVWGDLGCENIGLRAEKREVVVKTEQGKLMNKSGKN